MRKNKILWSTVLVVSIILLIGYGWWGSALFRVGDYDSYGHGYYGRGMMGRWFPFRSSEARNEKKLSVTQVKNAVNSYLGDYNKDLEMSDLFIFKDSDYYVSIEEKDTGKGAMELLINPYTGQIYPEYGPNMMWNEKYGMHSGYGMMGSGRWNMMGGTGQSGNYDYKSDSKSISREQAVKTADEYVKDKMGKEFSVPGEGHEFYGYYTFHINNGSRTVGMLSVNSYSGDVWYHDWHGELEQIISDHED